MFSLDINNNNALPGAPAHTNNGIWCMFIPTALIFKAVVMKFIAPNKELIPDKCNENIARSTDGPECACMADKGGYHIWILSIHV